MRLMDCLIRATPLADDREFGFKAMTNGLPRQEVFKTRNRPDIDTLLVFE
jgi:hypothetical protein